MKTHKTRTDHHHDGTEKTMTTVKTDVIVENHKEMQKALPIVKWGDEVEDNNWIFKYLDSLFEAGDNHMSDVRRRIVMA